MARICPKCRRVNSDADAKCVICDTELPAPPPSVAAVTAVAAATPPAAQPAEPTTMPTPESGEQREKLIWSDRASYKDMLGPWIAWAAAAIALLALALLFLRQVPDGFLVVAARWLALVIVVVSGIWLTWRTMCKRWATGYRLTEERLFVDRGLLSRTTDQTELIRVDDVRVRQGALQRLFNLGDVIVISTDATDRRLVISGISDPNAVAEHVRTHMRRLRKKGLYVESL